MEIKGQIRKIIYNKNDYHIFTLSDNTKIKVEKIIPFDLKNGIYVQVKGDFVNEEKFGRTFIAKDITQIKKTASFELLSIAIDGISEKKAKEIIDDIGDYEILKKNPFKITDYFLPKASKSILEQIHEKKSLFTSNDRNVIAKQMSKEIKGIGIKKINQWMDDLEDIYTYDTSLFLDDEILLRYLGSQTTVNIYYQVKNIAKLENIYNNLIDLKIPDYAINYLFKDFKCEVLNKIQQNPYILLDYGLSFLFVDNIAIKKFKVNENSSTRIINGVLANIKQHEKNGNTFVYLKDCITETSKLLDLDELIIDASIEAELKSKEPEFILKDDMLYRRVIFFTERKLGIMISNKVKEQKNIVPDYISQYIKSTKLSDSQQNAVLNVLADKISILTGGPGTGKTTTINEVCNCLDKMNKKYFLCAPTGRAAKRITESTKREAKTLHRLLEYKSRGIFGTFARNEKYPLWTDYVIVDESSMLDVYMLNSLMKAIKNGTSIIFVGDIDQLPSVSMGSVLRDMKDSGKVNVYELTEIFRQGAESYIIKNAYNIKFNRPLEVNNNDFKFIKVNNLADVKKELEKIDYEYQILCPMRVGDIGTIRINELMQNIKNSDSKKSIYSNGQMFKVNDYVIQCDNDYDKEIYNGEIGQIININDNYVTVKYKYNNPDTISYKISQMYELDLSYAISVHKSQGSESDNIVLIVDGKEDFLSKELIYTAVTRAKKSIVILSTYGIDFYSNLKTSNNRMTNLNNTIL